MAVLDKQYNYASRPLGDFYRTPAYATEKLIEIESIPRSHTIWEPACGNGAISKILEKAGYSVISSDLYDWGYGACGLDFLKAEAGPLANWLITNPPFLLAEEFLHKALSLNIPYIALFLRLAFLESSGRFERIFSQKDKAPSRVWVSSKRLTCWRGDDKNAKEIGGSMALGWFVWGPERGNNGTKLGHF